MTGRTWLGCAMVAGVIGGGGSAAQGANLENHALALSGRTDQFGPGFSVFGDDTFGQFGRPTINNARQVAFGSSNSAYAQFQFGVASIGSLMLYTPNTGLELIARAEGSGGGYGNVETPFLSESGGVAFRGFASGSNTGFHVKPAGQSNTSVAAVGGTGSSAPPLAGTTYSSLTTFTSFGFRGDHLAFAGTLSGTGVSFNNDDIMARADGATQAQLLTREGAQGSNPLGTDNGTRTWGGNFVASAINSRGDVAFLSTFTGGSFGLSMWGTVSGATGDVTTLALQGTTVPGTNNTQAYTFLQGAGRIDINDAGDTVFMGRAGTSQPNVLLKNVAGTTTLLARANDVIDGVTISGFNNTRDPVITGNGTVIFEANITTGLAGSFGVFKHDPTTSLTDMLYATGDVTYGPGDGLRFADIHSVSANAQGDFTFYAQLAGTGVTGDGLNDEAFFAYRNGRLEIVAREGDLFDVDPTAGVDLHRIHAIINDSQLINVGGQDGRRSNINDNGDVVFSLIFNNTPGVYTAGVFINSVPEPMSLALLGGGAMLLLTRRRR